MEQATVHISKRALITRINRKLQREGVVLRMSRSVIMKQQVDLYYVLDLRRDSIARQHVGIESFGRELKAMQPWEKLAAE
jgi:hypothetical protein